MIGKRKRETVFRAPPKPSPKTTEVENEADSRSHNIFRKHFEARFKALPDSAEPVVNNGEESDVNGDGTSVEGSDWEGLSDTEDDPPVVEVVHVANELQDHEGGVNKAQAKAFMSSRAPRGLSTLGRKKEQKPSEDPDLTEQMNLKHDVDLQRLLNESHLLEKSRASLTPGKERQKALDLRIQSLGAKESIFEQQNLPMSHRRGIAEKTAWRENVRRQRAKENGIILEKAVHKPKATTRRNRSVDGPGVGKFSGGTLKLSQRDVASIQGPPTKARTMRKGRRR